MILNMRKLSRTPKSRNIPIQISQPPMQIWISAPNIPNIRLEMLYIHNIKSNNRSEQSDICFRDFFAIVKRSLGYGRKMLFGSIERGEKGSYGFGVGFLGGGEARFVHAVVDVVVGPFVCGFYFLL
jgi:hypothetical protein